MFGRSFVLSLLALMVVAALDASSGRDPQEGAPSPIEALQIRPHFFMLSGAGGNVALQTGSDGAVVVDAGAAGRTEALLAAIRRVTDKPIRYIINTSADVDHVGGNADLARAGRTIFQTASALGRAMTNEGAAGIIAYETVLFRMSGATGAAAFPTAAWPTDTHAQARRTLYLNDEGVEFLHQPAAHTDGDLAVFFRRSDVIVAGDVIDTTRFPVIDVARGGSIAGEIAALNRLVELAIPSIPFVWKNGGTYIVPGHGRVYSQADVVQYRDMVVVVHDRVQDLVKQGKSLAEIQSASPAQGYVRAFGAETGDWTTAMFIESIYRSLTAERR